MQKFKERWEITQNWQLAFPLFGSLGLLYSAYRLSHMLLSDFSIFFVIALTLVISYALLKLFLFLFKKLEKKWIVDYKWEMIRIFIVFAITGSSSVIIGKPLLIVIGITKENLNIALYWFLYIFIGLIFYQILLVSLGFLFGQFKFFWEFEKKMLRRLGLKRFLD
ncbi:hypothetical protein OAD62_05835 [Oceanihabitans sp.]|nr:hypothetical protein [Oceanihabitans sp.]